MERQKSIRATTTTKVTVDIKMDHFYYDRHSDLGPGLALAKPPACYQLQSTDTLRLIKVVCITMNRQNWEPIAITSDMNVLSSELLDAVPYRRK